MKLPIKDKYFQLIKNGIKNIEIRDAHITFINEETKEEMTKKIIYVLMEERKYLPTELSNSEMFVDEVQIYFGIGD